MSIVPIFSTTVTVPEIVMQYLVNPDALRRFNDRMSDAFIGNLASGGYEYGKHLWADFHLERSAKCAERRAHRVIADFIREATIDRKEEETHL